MLEKLFKLRENGTDVRTEVMAGITTFMTMAYIIALNPNLLTGFGAQGGSQLWNGVFLATCIASAIGTACMAFLANKPFAMAPGMGLNSFFAVVVANIVTLTGMSYLQSFQTALCVILIEGIVFIILSVLKVREKIVEAIPLGIRLGIAPAIGLMLLNIGIGSNAGVYSSDGGPFYVMRDFFGALTPSLAKANMGDGYPQMVLTVVTMFVGLFLIVLFAHKKIKGSVLLGMLCASGICAALCPKMLLAAAYRHNQTCKPEDELYMFPIRNLGRELKIELVSHRNAMHPMYIQDFVHILQEELPRIADSMSLEELRKSIQ